jgi:membrane associated rhomboid family serine protease
MNLWDEIKALFSRGSNLAKLIYINIAVFLVLSVIAIVNFLMNDPGLQDKALGFLAAPASLKTLAIRPWTVITYMFTHSNIWHILFNMLWLSWFGKIFLEFLDQRKLVAVYLLGGISGAFLYILSFNVFPVFSNVTDVAVAIGASASVMAIVFAIATYVPNYNVNLFLFGRVKIIWIALVILAFTSFMNFADNTGGKLAHIGGALYGYIFALNLKKGKDIGAWINRVIDFLVSLFKPKPKIKVTYSRPKNDFEYNTNKAEHQEIINKILDKISKGGYDSLTKEEKEILFRESQNR